MEKKQKKKQILSYIRLGIYVLFTVYSLALGNNVYMGLDICPLHRIFGVLCPTCGATRACISLLKLDFASALDYNAVFTFSVFPIAFIVIVQDIFTTVVRLFSKKDTSSLLERWLVWMGF